VGGDARWLHGLQYAPKKLANLYQLNKILAHQPWLLDRQHIEVDTNRLQSTVFLAASCQSYLSVEVINHRRVMQQLCKELDACWSGIVNK